MDCKTFCSFQESFKCNTPIIWKSTRTIFLFGTGTFTFTLVISVSNIAYLFSSLTTTVSQCQINLFANIMVMKILIVICVLLVNCCSMPTNDELSEAEDNCVRDVLSKPPPEDGNLYCAAIWDGWGCWDYTPAGNRAFISCPSYIEGFDPNLQAHKMCTAEGTWWLHPATNRPWANYTTCVHLGCLSCELGDEK